MHDIYGSVEFLDAVEDWIERFCDSEGRVERGERLSGLGWVTDAANGATVTMPVVAPR